MLPFPANDTCDIYRNGSSPPSAPAVAGVGIHVVPRFRNIKGSFAGLFHYTHVIYLPLGTDVRDSWNGAPGPAGDKLYIADKNSGFYVVVQLVARRRLGSGYDYLEAYCHTGSITYPTDEG